MAKQLIPLGAGTNPNGSRAVPFLPLKNQRPDPVRHSISTSKPVFLGKKPVAREACVCNGRWVSPAGLILKLFAFYLAAEFRRP